MKNAQIQLLRIIACFFVIVNHTNSVIFKATDISFTWFLSIAYMFISKTAVPVFIMITGYTMLHKEDTWEKTGKRLFRILICLVMFSLIYYLNGLGIKKIATFNILQFFSIIWTKQITTAFWYLYLYIGILLMMPFLQKVAKAMERKDFHILFLISFVIYGVLPIFAHYFPDLKLCKYFEAPFFGSCICLLFLGDYFYRYFKKENKLLLVSIVAGICMLILNVVATYFEYIKSNGENYLFFENRYFPANVITSCCIFYIVFSLKDCIQRNNKLQKVILFIGECTFGIYLLSDLIRVELSWTYKQMSVAMYPMFAMLIYEIIVFLVGFVVVILLKKIPWLKKLM